MCGWKPPGSGLHEADKRVKDNLSALLEEPGLADFSKIMPKVRRERESWGNIGLKLSSASGRRKSSSHQAKPETSDAMIGMADMSRKVIYLIKRLSICTATR